MQDISLLIDYIEGRLSACDFRDILSCDEGLESEIRKAYAYEISSPDYNVNTLISRLNFAKQEDRDILDAIVERLLKHFGQEYKKPKNEKFELTVSDVLLSFLSDDIQAEKFVFENIFQQIPTGLTTTEQKQFCKKRQKDEFRYEYYPPKWIQSGEWPFDELGHPMIFSKSYKGSQHSVIYVFINPINGNVVEIKQYD